MIHLQLAATKFRFIEQENLMHCFWLQELDIGMALCLPIFVGSDCDSVYSATWLQMLLNFLGSTRVIHLQRNTLLAIPVPIVHIPTIILSILID